MADINELRALRDNPNVKNFLNMISAAEGTSANGYATLFGGSRIGDLSKHPGVRQQFKQTDGKTNTTTAAGRYQFLSSTWNNLQKRLKLPDFGPESQDLAAIELLREKGAVNDILKGDYQKAVKRVSSTWASLPGSPHPQGTRSWDFVTKALGGDLGDLSDNREYPVASSFSPAQEYQRLALEAKQRADQSAADVTANTPAAVSADQTQDPFASLNAFTAQNGLDVPQANYADLAPLASSVPTPDDVEWGSRINDLLIAPQISADNDAALTRMFGDDPGAQATNFGPLPENISAYLDTLISGV